MNKTSRSVAIIYQALDFLGLFVLDRRARSGNAFPCPTDGRKRLHRRKRPPTPDSICPFVPICALCREPVSLEICKADARGQAVHEDCYTMDLCPREDGGMDSKANDSAGA
jgi:hypothetical protein